MINLIENRLPFSRRWQVRKREDGTIMPGPFTIELRKGILEKLLNMQVETKMDLISEDEIEEIKRIWKRDELVLKCLNTDTKKLKVVCGPKEEIL